MIRKVLGLLFWTLVCPLLVALAFPFVFLVAAIDRQTPIEEGLRRRYAEFLAWVSKWVLLFDPLAPVVHGHPLPQRGYFAG